MTRLQPSLPPLGAEPPRAKLLIVDDQPFNIQALHRVLGDEHQVFMATSGEQALAVAREQQPDLVLLDVVMPGMDGFETCQRMKADEALQDTPIVFVTAHGDAVAETRGLEAGAVDFIAKPINPNVVRARVRTHLTLKRQADLLRRLVFIDGLTGVSNRRLFDEHLEREWRRCLRRRATIAVLLVDIDHFKLYNDRHGHPAGDACLRAVAQALATVPRRPGDLLARFGGEEFACVLPDTDADGALAVAESMLRAVRALAVPHGVAGAGAHVTVSIGVGAGTASERGGAPALVLQADATLYAAKAGGRDRVATGRPAALATGAR